MLTLRARIATTVLLASLICALIAAVLIGAVMLAQQKRFETQRIDETYSVATNDLNLGNLVSLINGIPAIDEGAMSTITTLCQATGVGINLIPSYATTTGRSLPEISPVTTCRSRDPRTSTPSGLPMD